MLGRLNDAVVEILPPACWNRQAAGPCCAAEASLTTLFKKPHNIFGLSAFVTLILLLRVDASERYAKTAPPARLIGYIFVRKKDKLSCSRNKAARTMLYSFSRPLVGVALI